MPEIIDESRPINEIGKNNKKSLATNPPEEKEEVGKIDIEKNILIHTMPRKFKVSANGARSGKTKIVGIIIMIAGVLILIALVYLAYIYLIKAPAQPKEPTVKTEIPKEIETPEEEEVEEEVEEPKIEETPVEEEEIATTTEETATSSQEATSTEELPVEGIVQDSDEDGLSDLEEEIFGSDINLADSDGDGYEDKGEVGNLYNPAGTGLLADNPNISQYQNSAFGYRLLYPAIWFEQSIGDASSVIFGATNGSFVQIISQANEDKMAIDDWFVKQFPEETVKEGDIMEGDNWQGIFHKDKKIFYLTDTDNGSLFIISYVPEPEDSLDYYNIFKMAIDSFQIES